MTGISFPSELPREQLAHPLVPGTGADGKRNEPGNISADIKATEKHTIIMENKKRIRISIHSDLNFNRQEKLTPCDTIAAAAAVALRSIRSHRFDSGRCRLRLGGDNEACGNDDDHSHDKPRAQKNDFSSCTHNSPP